MAKTDAMTELKPCPFCGGKAELLIQSETDGTWCVECSECGASGPGGPTAGAWSEQEAIDDWNERNPATWSQHEIQPNPTGDKPMDSQPPKTVPINFQGKLKEQKTQKVMRETAQVVRDAIQTGRYTIGVYFIDAQDKLQNHFLQTVFPYGDFPKIEQHFRSKLSEVLKARTTVKAPAEQASPTAVLDDLAEGKGFQPRKLPDVVDVPPEELEAPSALSPIAGSHEQPDDTPE